MNKITIGPDRSLEMQQLEEMRREMQDATRRHYQSRTVAVTIPFYQAAISGFLAAVLIAILLYAFGARAKWILVGFALTWIAVTGIVWWVRLKDWNNLVWNMEQQLQMDLSGDNVIGKPPPTIRAEVSNSNGNIRMADLSGNSLYLFFRAIRGGQDISESRWTPQKNGFSKPEYWRTVADLIRLGVLHWRNEDAHAQGVAPTPDAPEILDQWLEEIERGSYSPTPGDGSARTL